MSAIGPSSTAFLCFNGRFPGKPGDAPGFSSTAEENYKWHGSLRAICPSCHLANSVKVLKNNEALTSASNLASSFLIHRWTP